ncbi:MAG: Abi family protein [Firmicutes bacterium]|nr:Abi family protein [Bacillota bacterium]
MKHRKEKLTIKQQIEHMKSKGIRFKLVKPKEAEKFITDQSYYFKIKAYAKNFKKDEKKQDNYSNLDFAYLVELSTLDMHLRRTIFHLCVNIEHAIKVQILSHCCSKVEEEGYSIVESFRIKQRQSAKDKKRQPREMLQKNQYTEKIHEKYKSSPAIWNFVEMISFGDLIEFYRHYFKIHDKKLCKLSDLLFFVKQIRNASAHNNCLLANMITPYQIKPSYMVQNYLIQHSSKGDISSNLWKKKLTIAILHDFAAVLYCFKQFVKSDKIIAKTFEELDTIVVRFKEKQEYFDKNRILQENLKIFEKTVDIFRPIV